jgi:hypothetical protein
MATSKASAAKGMLPASSCHGHVGIGLLTYNSAAKTSNKEFLVPQPARASASGNNGRNRRPSDKVAAQRLFFLLYGSS